MHNHRNTSNSVCWHCWLDFWRMSCNKSQSTERKQWLQPWKLTSAMFCYNFQLSAYYRTQWSSSASVCYCVLGQVSENEVCGCPLVVNMFDLSGEFCRVAKRRCNRHYAWEKLRLAEVDTERLRQVTNHPCLTFYNNNNKQICIAP